MNSDKIMVSISCCAFNQERYIRDALEGFVKQKTNFKFEVLVHDDASTDGTPDIIKEYAEKYPEIIKPLYQKENQYSQHISIRKTFQIPRMSGKYVATCEGDDYWTDPLKLQKQVDFLEANPDYALCATACTWFNMRDNIEEKQFIIQKDMDVPLEDILLEENGRIFPTVSVMMRREVYTTFPNWLTKFPVGDIALFINAGLFGRIRMLADNTCVYRWHAVGSWTKTMENPAKKIEFKNRFIEGFRQLDIETDHKYKTYIDKRIKKEQFTVEIINKNWKVLKSSEYSEEWRNLTIKSKLSVFLRCKLPFINKIARKLLHGE